MEADLWDLGFDLDHARASGVSPRKLARLLLAQPAGARIWQEIGGWQALPEAVVMQHQQMHLDVVIHHAQSGQKGSPPKPPAPPVGLIEKRRREKTRAATHESKARAFLEATDTPDMRAELEARLASWGDVSKLKASSQMNAFARERMADWGK